MNVRWSHCVLKVRDVKRITDFYHDILGFRIADRGPLGPEGSPEIVFMSGSSSDHHQMAVVATRGEEEATSLDHNAFRVDSLADVREVMERIKAHPDVDRFAPLTHGNAISVYFPDPEGNGVEVFCDTPWHVPQPQGRGWNPEQTDAEVLANVEAEFKDIPGFMPMEQYREQMRKEYGE